jgi:hypothetical protein
MWEGRDYNLAGIYNDNVRKDNTVKRMEKQIEDLDEAMGW